MAGTFRLSVGLAATTVQARGRRCRNGFCGYGNEAWLFYWCTIPARAGSSGGHPAGRTSSTPSLVCGGRKTTSRSRARGSRSHVEKSRAHFGDAERPFEASLISTPDGRGLTWSASDLKPSHLEEVVALFRSGVTVRAVAAQLGIARSSAGRLRQKAQEDGLLESDDVTEAGGGEDESGTLH